VITLFQDVGGWKMEKIVRHLSQAQKRNSYPYKPDDSTSLSHDSVFSIYLDRFGTLWIGTALGLNRYDREKENFIRYFHDPDDPYSLSRNDISSICEDSVGSLWIGTALGLNRYDREKENFIRYFHDPDDPYSLSRNDISSICEDSSGSLWIGTALGLNRFDREKENFIISMTLMIPTASATTRFSHYIPTVSVIFGWGRAAD
jgi:ligand-binding sensor domain-containing protein